MLQGEGVPKHLCGLGNKGVRLMSWKFIICHIYWYTSLNSPEEGIIVITPAFYPGANWGSERVHQGAGLELWSVWAWSWASQPLSILDCQVQMVSASRASRGRQRPRHHFSSGLVWSGLVWTARVRMLTSWSQTDWKPSRHDILLWEFKASERHL